MESSKDSELHSDFLSDDSSGQQSFSQIETSCQEDDFFGFTIPVAVAVSASVGGAQPRKNPSHRKGARHNENKREADGPSRSNRGKIPLFGFGASAKGSTEPEDRSDVNPVDSNGQPNVPVPRMKRYRGVGEIAGEEVLAKSGVRPSAAFPAGLDTIGPQSFRKLKLLGKGGAGTVYLVNLRGTDMVYAMKELTKEDMIKRKKVLRVMTEREILASANHPFIVTMYATFQTQTRLCFVMDYCAGGEFFGVLSSQPKKRLGEEAARFYAAEVLLALEYLHYLGFYYRDLKPENILMRDSGHVALTDFDLSKQAQAVSPRMIEHQKTMMEKLSGLMGANKSSSRLCAYDIVDSEPVLEAESTSFVGTLEYLAPELVKGEGQNASVDWWTFGILIFEMMTGSTPFRAKTSDEILAKITGNHRVQWESDIGSASARRLVKGLLRRDPKKRLGAENGASDIKKSSWFSSVNFSLIRNERPPIVPGVVQLSDFDGIDLDCEEPTDGDSEDSAEEKTALFADFDMKRDERGLKQY